MILYSIQGLVLHIWAIMFCNKDTPPPPWFQNVNKGYHDHFPLIDIFTSQKRISSFRVTSAQHDYREGAAWSLLAICHCLLLVRQGTFFYHKGNVTGDNRDATTCGVPRRKLDKKVIMSLPPWLCTVKRCGVVY